MILQMNKGNETLNAISLNLLTEEIMKLCVARSQSEKLLLLLKDLTTTKAFIFRCFTKRNRRCCQNVLTAFVDNYSSFFHRSITMKPL